MGPGVSFQTLEYLCIFATDSINGFQLWGEFKGNSPSTPIIHYYQPKDVVFRFLHADRATQIIPRSTHDCRHLIFHIQRFRWSKKWFGAITTCIRRQDTFGTDDRGPGYYDGRRSSVIANGKMVPSRWEERPWHFHQPPSVLGVISTCTW